jgi:hypothetical protein
MRRKKVTEDTPVYGEADLRHARHDDYWALRGEVAEWMEVSGKDKAATILYLRRIIAELQMALHSNHAWRLSRLEQVLELPAEPEEEEGKG